jgi:hypothetical protein
MVFGVATWPLRVLIRIWLHSTDSKRRQAKRATREQRRLYVNA